jgi:hypothetical protein
MVPQNVHPRVAAREREEREEGKEGKDREGGRE